MATQFFIKSRTIVRRRLEHGPALRLLPPCLPACRVNTRNYTLTAKQITDSLETEDGGLIGQVAIRYIRVTPSFLEMTRFSMGLPWAAHGSAQMHYSSLVLRLARCLKHMFPRTVERDLTMSEIIIASNTRGDTAISPQTQGSCHGERMIAVSLEAFHLESDQLFFSRHQVQ